MSIDNLIQDIIALKQPPESSVPLERNLFNGWVWELEDGSDEKMIATDGAK